VVRILVSFAALASFAVNRLLTFEIIRLAKQPACKQTRQPSPWVPYDSNFLCVSVATAAVSCFSFSWQ
jgi:hypothetical protein